MRERNPGLTISELVVHAQDYAVPLGDTFMLGDRKFRFCSDESGRPYVKEMHLEATQLAA